MLSKAVNLCQVPIIASGGVGDFEHFVAGMQIEGMTGASTANIFNFIGEGLTEARNHILSRSIHLGEWNFNVLTGSVTGL